MTGEHLIDGKCELPGGLVLEHGRVLTDAVIRPLLGREEEWLVRNANAPAVIAVTRVLRACLLRIGNVKATPELVGRLLVGDRDYLMLQLRRLTLGERFQAVVSCPACAAKIDVEFSARDVPVDRYRQTEPFSTMDLGDSRSFCFRLPTGADQEAVLGLPLLAAVDSLLARCLAGLGSPGLSADEQAAVIEAMERIAPRVELELDLACPDCGFQFPTAFDTTAYFLREMRASGRQLLRETHALAFHYHWSEREILGLRRDRRKAYLDLISDELRTE